MSANSSHPLPRSESINIDGLSTHQDQTGSDEPGFDPSASTATDAEISAWRKYHALKVGYPDMLDIKKQSPSDEVHDKANLRVYEVAENLRERWKENLPCQ
jgi:hypothetical protein